MRNLASRTEMKEYLLNLFEEQVAEKNFHTYVTVTTGRSVPSIQDMILEQNSGHEL